MILTYSRTLSYTFSLSLSHTPLYSPSYHEHPALSLRLPWTLVTIKNNPVVRGEIGSRFYITTLRSRLAGRHHRQTLVGVLSHFVFTTYWPSPYLSSNYTCFCWILSSSPPVLVGKIRPRLHCFYPCSLSFLLFAKEESTAGRGNLS